ncbi:MAG TPA: ABC transporter ATP-binding protein [Phycisphaerae bacterium]|nr:ABC transporter ATP-binding protein [Phycisphaerae bacterium]HRW51959.1 ABC transporter ATP-binding protein [Phycisphaerae bacterium]
MPEPIVEVHDLRKIFPTTTGEEKRAVDGVSFEVAPGRIYGLLGPNGAGKTTTLRMIAGLLTPTGGRVRLNGHDPQVDRESAKRSLGYLTASTGLYERLSPREVLNYFGELIGLEAAHRKKRIEDLIHWLDMSAFADLRCGGLSTGQKQRTNIARALMGDPPILIMDEPTLGLDVLTNRVVLDFIRAEGARGKAIILSTHYLDDAEAICNEFGLIHDGRIVGRGDLAALRAQSGRTRLSEIFLALCGEDQHVLSGVPGATDHSSTREVE